MPRVIVIAIALCFAGCGDSLNTSFTPDESFQVWRVSNTLLHSTHEEAFLNDGIAPPPTFTYDCDDGGQIDMITTQEEGDSNLRDLLHDFKGCMMEDIIMDGPMHYFDLEECDGGGFRFAIEGNFTLSGALDGSCRIQGAEECASPFGVACGNDV